MKRTAASGVFAFVLLACGLAGLSASVSAQDGPIRQRVKERWMQRHQPANAEATSTEGTIMRPGDYRYTIQHDGLTRQYAVHVPAGYTPATSMPLLVALHGGGGSMEFQADDHRYGLITKSEQEGFIAVFPNGYSKLRSGKLATWNAGKCCGGARDNNVDDVGFIRQVVANVTQQVNIDRKRIYATGMSNGAMMAYRLACDMPDVFSAVAAVAGTDNTVSCNPRTPVSILHIHAKNDTHVLFDGGAGPGVPNERAVTDFTSVSDTVSKWARIDGCTASPRRVLNTAGAYCEVYSPCRGNAEVELCVTQTGGHSWPGAAQTRGEPASQAISANDVMWDFFNRR